MKKSKWILGALALLVAAAFVQKPASEGIRQTDKIGLSNAESSYTQAAVSLGIPQNVTVSRYGYLLLQLDWQPGSVSGIDTDKVSYLIYRSETTDDNDFVNIGYTKPGVTTFIDGGQNGSLVAGKEYFYKVQAYDSSSGATSNKYNTQPVSGIAEAIESPWTEFYNDADAIAFLKNALLNRNTHIEFYVWLKTLPSGYYEGLKKAAVEEKESLTDNSSSGDYFKFHSIRNTGSLDDMRAQRNGLTLYRLTYNPTYYTTSSEEQAVNVAVRQIIANDLNCTMNSSDYDKAKAVYEFLASLGEYDTSLRGSSSRVTAYDCLVLNKSVCQGYANAAYKMLRELGVMNRIVSGEVYYEGQWRVHAWNYVLIDGEWYNFDATSEDHFYESYGWISYKWFLKTDADCGDFHIVEEKNDDNFVQNHPGATTSKIVPITDSLTLTATNISSTTIKINWNKLDRATGYALYRSTSPNGTFTKIADIAGRETADKNITNGTVYYYKVRAYEKCGSQNAYSSYSSVVPAITLTTPVLSSTSFEMLPQGVQVTLPEITGATGYNLFRKKAGDSSYTKIASNITNRVFVDKTAEPSTEYCYLAQARYDNDNLGLHVLSSNSNSKSVTTPARTPAITATPSSGVTIKLSWSQVSGATAYEIYRSSSENGNYTLVKTTTGLSSSDTNLTAGTRYYYRVAAYKTSNGAKKYLTFWSNAKATVTLATPTLNSVSSNAKGVVISWSKASGADCYNIYRATSANGTYSYVASVLSGTLTYTDTSAESGKTYYYRVRPYKKFSGVVYYGGYSSYKSINYLAQPKLSASPKSGVTMSLSWNAIPGASAYEIYRSSSLNGTYTLLKTTTGTSTSDTNLTAGTRYYYKIRAVKNTSSGKIYSNYCSASAAVTLATPSAQGITRTANGTTITWSKASGADRYNVYRATSPDGPYEYVASVLGGQLSYTDTSTGTTQYYYKVRPYKRVDGVVYYGGYSGKIG
ncbi:MAG: hypothetical protein J5379_09500 [Clostridiales bacterium]|nr:hypothetical protein [Clostridiales bacterium]